MAEEYTPMEKAAMKWLDETDTIQFSQMELLTMFAESQLKEAKELLKSAQPIWNNTSNKWEDWFKRVKELI